MGLAYNNYLIYCYFLCVFKKIVEATLTRQPDVENLTWISLNVLFMTKIILTTKYFKKCLYD